MEVAAAGSISVPMSSMKGYSFWSWTMILAPEDVTRKGLYSASSMYRTTCNPEPQRQGRKLHQEPEIRFLVKEGSTVYFMLSGLKQNCNSPTRPRHLQPVTSLGGTEYNKQITSAENVAETHLESYITGQQ